MHPWAEQRLFQETTKLRQRYKEELRIVAQNQEMDEELADE